MSLGLSSPFSVLDILALVVSILSLAASIWAARSARREVEVATQQYKLSVEQHRQTLFSNIIGYMLHERFNLLERQLVLGITNAGQVPIVSVKITVTYSNSLNPVYSSIIPILFQHETKTIPIGDTLYKFLESINIVSYTQAGHRIETAETVSFQLKCEWKLSVALPTSEDILRWKLVLTPSDNSEKGKHPVFDVALEADHEQ